MKDNKTILVTGSGGQLGCELQDIAPAYPDHRFLFVTKEEFPVNDDFAVRAFFAEHHPDICINCAAYTAVDKAESEKEAAFAVNAEAVGNLAMVCREQDARLIHISTDYVFDGTATAPYKEDDPVSPVNVYGASKLRGEELALQQNPDTVIIRTSWVYSAYGNNFVKTMLRLMKERESINVVNDQWGCPTYAADLARVIMEMIEIDPEEKAPYPLFNFCNEGAINWYDFALEIKELTLSACTIKPIPSSAYPTAAKRPKNSVLDCSRIREYLQINIPGWKGSLARCLERMND